MEYVTKYYFKSDSSIKPCEKEKYLHKYSIFDERNNLIEECEFGESYSITKLNNSIVSIYHYKDYKKIAEKTFYYYDSTNKLISEEYWHYRNNEKDELGLKCYYLYDKNNVKYGYINEEHDTIRYKLVKKNDTLLNEEGIKFRVQDEDTVFYNTLGNPIFKNEYYKGELNNKREYFYNEKDKLIKEIKSFNISYLEPEVTIYKYNTKDSLISIVTSSQYSLRDSFYYKYYKNGKLKKVKKYYNNLPHYTVSFKYKKIK